MVIDPLLVPVNVIQDDVGWDGYLYHLLDVCLGSLIVVVLLQSVDAALLENLLPCL